MSRKFVIVSKDMSGLGFALLAKKGDTVWIARNPDMDKFEGKEEEYEQYKNVGKGLVNVFDLADVMKSRGKMKDWYWVFDGNHSVEENELLRKEGFKVCLGGELTFKMENDREYGIKLAEELGIPSPEWKDFKSAEEGIKYLEAHPDKAYVFKPNAADESYLTTVPQASDPKRANENMRTFIKSIGINDFILQEKVKGIEINMEYTCQRGEVMSAQINLEAKRISEASPVSFKEKGAMCGCAFDICKDIPLDSPLVKETIAKLLPFIKKHNFTGFADLNCIISENEIYFIEWCWRPGYNEHPNYFMNISNVDYLNTMADLCDGTYKKDVKCGWGASVTVFVDHPHEGIPIDVPEDIKDVVFYFDAMKKDETIVETGCSQEIAIVGGYDYRIKDAMAKAYENVDKIDIINIDFRSDGMRDDYPSSPIRRWQCLSEMGKV